MRFNCYTVNEILCWLDINDPDCKRKVCIMQRILRDFYTHITGTKMSRVWIQFTWDWLKTIQFPHWVKQVHKFLIEWDDSCLSKRLFRKVDDWDKCWCNANFELLAEEVRTTPKEWQYRFTRENDQLVLKLNVPKWVTQWRITYSRWPDIIETRDDKICIDDNALVLLQHLIQKAYAEQNREIQLAQYHKNEFNELLKKEELNQERLPYRIIWAHQEFNDNVVLL